VAQGVHTVELEADNVRLQSELEKACQALAKVNVA
jgi:hypothetical protein